jgi:hypothetical protein
LQQEIEQILEGIKNPGDKLISGAGKDPMGLYVPLLEFDRVAKLPVYSESNPEAVSACIVCAGLCHAGLTSNLLHWMKRKTAGRLRRKRGESKARPVRTQLEY